MLHYFYRQDSRKILADLMVLATRLNRLDFHVFVGLSGHTNHLRVRVYPKGYGRRNEHNGEPIYLLDDYLPGFTTFGKIKPRDMKEAMRLLVSMSKTSHLR